MRLRGSVLLVALGAVVVGGATVLQAAPCNGDEFSGTWCKREVSGTNPQEYSIEFTATTTGSAGVVGMVTSNGSASGNLGVGKSTPPSTSKGIAKSSKNTKITGGLTVMLQCKDASGAPCKPPSTEKQGNCGATSGDQVIPTCNP